MTQMPNFDRKALELLSLLPDPKPEALFLLRDALKEAWLKGLQQSIELLKEKRDSVQEELDNTP